jgi:hypothetical protein
MNPSHAPLYSDLTDEQNCAALVELFDAAEAFASNPIEGPILKCAAV